MWVLYQSDLQILYSRDNEQNSQNLPIFKWKNDYIFPIDNNKHLKYFTKK